jgi:hypothetical protein
MTFRSDAPGKTNGRAHAESSAQKVLCLRAGRDAVGRQNPIADAARLILWLNPRQDHAC